MAFHMYSQGLISPVMRISNVNIMFQSVYVSMDRIYSFLSRQSGISSGESCFIPEGRLSGNVRYGGVSFSYGDVQVLRNVNMEFLPEKLTAIVGKRDRQIDDPEPALPPVGCGGRMHRNRWQGYPEI